MPWLMQVLGCRGDATGNAQRHVRTEPAIVGVDIARCRTARLGSAGEVAEARVDQLHHQPGWPVGVLDNPPFDPDQVGMKAGGDAGVHFVQRRAVAGHFALVQLDRNRAAGMACVATVAR